MPRTNDSRRLLRTAAYLLYLLIVIEAGARAYWGVAHGVPLLASVDDWYARYFPGLSDSGITTRDLVPDDGHFDVVLLGGSVLDNLYDNQADALRRALHEVVGTPVLLYNLAYPAHTTRDSVLKYRRLHDTPVDLVIVYHAINDTRLNNISRERFRGDYTHASWYHEITRMEAHAVSLPFLTLPFTLEHALIEILGAKRFEFYVRRNSPNEAM